MFGLRITEICPSNSHMRSQLSPSGNNMNSVVRFHPNLICMFMLFLRSDPILRAKTVICVLS